MFLCFLKHVGNPLWLVSIICRLRLFLQDDNTPLLLTIGNGDANLAEFLINQNADVNLENAVILKFKSDRPVAFSIARNSIQR